MAVEIVDDKSEHCIPFILDKIKAHCDYHKKEGTDAPPFFLGLNGIQGAGKTTLVSQLVLSRQAGRSWVSTRHAPLPAPTAYLE